MSSLLYVLKKGRLFGVRVGFRVSDQGSKLLARSKQDDGGLHGSEDVVVVLQELNDEEPLGLGFRV